MARANFVLCTCVSFLSVVLPSVVMAQQAPSAGQIFQQEQQQAPVQPRQTDALRIEPLQDAPVASGGQMVQLTGVAFEGNTVFDDAALLAVVGDIFVEPLDLAQLRQIANGISDFYRASGYPFARAFLPPQSLSAGILQISVVEGVYGRVQVVGDDPALNAAAQPWLDVLKTGEVISSRLLERVTLLTDDLPGVVTTPVIKPGQVPGSGDLEVRILPSQLTETTLGYDNHGNRYTGLHRLRANVNINSPFMLGDQVSISALASDMHLALGSVNYSAPLGTSGLRGNVGYSHTEYKLGKEFKTLASKGTARVISVGLSYPIIRSQRANLTVVATTQDKRFKDSNNQNPASERKSSQTTPIALQFDRRDNLGGGGINFGSATLTHGRLKVGDDPNNTRGTFNKFNLDVVRLQAVTPSVTFYARFNAQEADKNLDSSEGMSAGGANAVRAYPSGEWSGDVGWLTQLELRYSMGAYAPYAFYDHSRIKANAKGAGNTTREYAGYGAGLRYLRGAWSADLAVAWRSKGGRPADSNERDAKPRVWLSAGYRF